MIAVKHAIGKLPLGKLPATGPPSTSIVTRDPAVSRYEVEVLPA